MPLGLVGKKRGMTRLFLEDGCSVPVTVVSVSENRVTQIKNKARDKYDAVQITVGVLSSSGRSRMNKSIKGHFLKTEVEAGKKLCEFRIDDGVGSDVEVPNIGDVLGVSLFKPGQKVDVSGCSKGKGFQGVVKRWGFRTQDMSHGNSLSHRASGSIGQCQNPGRVFKGKKMCGHMGNEKVTIQSLEVVRVDLEKGLLMIIGGIPGAINSDVIVRPAVKYRNRGK